MTPIGSPNSAAPAGNRAGKTSGAELAAGGTTGIEGAVTDPGGMAIGGGSSGPVGGIPTGRGAAGGGSGSGTGIGGTGTGGGTAFPSASAAARKASVIVVPPAIQRTTSPYESEVYFEVDHYVLYGENSTVGIRVPGNEICLEGNHLRTIDAMSFSQTRTDESKCRWLDYGEREEFRCTRDAYSIVTTSNFLSSPVNYSVNMCLAYDKSSCDWRDGGGDGPEREFCKASGVYKGIWAEGTQFFYPCAKSTSQSYTHPLQYQVRFVQDIEFPESRSRQRIVQREMRNIPRCN